MAGGNYPPGMTSRDFVRAGIDDPHHHEHEFMPMDSHGPLIEDGAAVFIEECRYGEGEFGWQCEEQRSYRFEYDCLELLDGGEIDLPSIDEWDTVDDELQEVIIAIEEAFLDGDSKADLSSIHPNPDSGEVAIDYLGYTLVFRP